MGGVKLKQIGIILNQWKSNYRDYPIYGFKTDLMQTLRNYDVNILSIPILFENEDINKEFNYVKNIINLCDGIIIPGGAFIHDIDYKIVEYLYNENKPILGICLGMQIMGKTFNNKVRERIEDGSHNKMDNYVHGINIKKDSKLFDIMKEEFIQVNSRHERYIPYTNLDISAYSDDGIPEAIENKNKKFFIGVQWHPESLIDDIYSKRLFNAFIESL